MPGLYIYACITIYATLHCTLTLMTTMNGNKRRRVYWPCRVCLQECEADDNSICCDGCQAWLHADCIRMDVDTLRQFGEHGELTFYCAACALDSQQRYVRTFTILLFLAPEGGSSRFGCNLQSSFQYPRWVEGRGGVGIRR